MSIHTPIDVDKLTRAEIEASLTGTVLLEFGANWCSYCQAAQPIIAKALASHHNVKHIKIEDGQGKRLGRSFKVKLWPTLILLQDGAEVERLVRPENWENISALLEAIPRSS